METIADHGTKPRHVSKPRAMKIIPYSEDLRARWDAFCAESPEAYFWHTRAWSDYSLAYRPGSVDLSFAIEDQNGKLVAICPLLKEDEQFTCGGEPGPALAIHGLLDLRAPQEELWRGIRDSYHSLINQARKKYNFIVGGIAPAYWFTELHKQAFNAPRPERTYELMERSEEHTSELQSR